MTTYNQFKNDSHQTVYPPNQQNVPLQPVQGGYGYDNTTMIHIQQPDYEVTSQFSWAHFVMSLITFFLSTMCCCNPVSPILSLLGVVYSSNSYSSHGDKAWERSRRQNSVAKVFWIMSLVIMIIITVIAIIGLIIVFTGGV